MEKTIKWNNLMEMKFKDDMSRTLCDSKQSVFCQLHNLQLKARTTLIYCSALILISWVSVKGPFPCNLENKTGK